MECHSDAESEPFLPEQPGLCHPVYSAGLVFPAKWCSSLTGTMVQTTKTEQAQAAQR
jgi:hypothetical protein